MPKILTLHLLDTLISEGYHYCLSRTTAVQGEDASMCITLRPVKEKPSLQDLPELFDTYYNMGEELKQMANGMNETIILIELEHIDSFVM